MLYYIIGAGANGTFIHIRRGHRMQSITHNAQIEHTIYKLVVIDFI